MNAPHEIFGYELLVFSGLFLSSLFAGLLSTSYLIEYFGRAKILAEPDHRSMHTKAVPVGGGWSIIVLTLVAWIVFIMPSMEPVNGAVFGGAALLALLSWIDDRQLVSSALRFSLQAGVVLVVLFLLPLERTVFSDSWPLWIDRLATALCWVWFINLFNFMDGIDGLAGIEILFICAGLLFIGVEAGSSMSELYVVTVLAGATAGFLLWNWHPAKIFLGDVGSVPIGFLLGWLLIELAMDGYLVAAFLLPAYFVADASVTLLKRIYKAEPFWKPHKTHYYQRAAIAQGEHLDVVWRIMLTNAGLLGFALASLHRPVISAVCGVALLVSILFILERISAKR